MNYRDHNRLIAIQEEMLDLLNEAKSLIKHEGLAYDRAKAYWIGAVEMGLTNDHSYLGSAGVSMQDTIEETHPEDEEEDGEDEDDEDDEEKDEDDE